MIAVGYFEMRAAEDRYYNLADNASHSMKLHHMSQKFRTERNVYLYACSSLILLYVHINIAKCTSMLTPHACLSTSGPYASYSVMSFWLFPVIFITEEHALMHDRVVIRFSNVLYQNMEQEQKLLQRRTASGADEDSGDKKND